MRSGGPHSQEPSFTASRRVGRSATTAVAGSSSAVICSSVMPRTNPRGANTLTFSSKNIDASAMAFSSVSAMYIGMPMARSSPISVSRPALSWASLQAETTCCVWPAAAAPPMKPFMPCFAMKSTPLRLALTIGCQHSTGRPDLGTSVISSSS